MYAFISNEYRTVAHTQRQLDFLCNVYTYPQFKKVENYAEAHNYFNQCNREFLQSGLNKYGRDISIGYISIQYFIDGKNIYCNVGTKHFGFVKFKYLPKSVKQDASYDLLKLKICNVVLDDSLISNHCVAIGNILSLFSEDINVEIIVPDISVYLACTKYKGENFAILRYQDMIETRSGKVFYTIK